MIMGSFLFYIPWLKISTDFKGHWTPEHIPDVKLSIHFNGYNRGTLGVKFQWQTKHGWYSGLNVKEHHALGVRLLASTRKLDQEVDHVDVVSFALEPVNVIKACDSDFVAEEFH